MSSPQKDAFIRDIAYHATKLKEAKDGLRQLQARERSGIDGWTFRQDKVKCGKPTCKCNRGEPHLYWYAYRKINGKTKKKYVGKDLEAWKAKQRDLEADSNPKPDEDKLEEASEKKKNVHLKAPGDQEAPDMLVASVRRIVTKLESLDEVYVDKGWKKKLMTPKNLYGSPLQILDIRGGGSCGVTVTVQRESGSRKVSLSANWLYEKDPDLGHLIPIAPKRTIHA